MREKILYLPICHGNPEWSQNETKNVLMAWIYSKKSWIMGSENVQNIRQNYQLDNECHG